MQVDLWTGGPTLRLADHWQPFGTLPEDPPGTQAFGYKFTGGESGVVVVKPIAPDGAMELDAQSVIDGIRSVRSRRVVGRTPADAGAGFCRGVEVTVHFDEQRFAGSGVYLFACVLERFLGLYCSINSFSRLIATTNKREGELRRWSPRAGEKVLL